MPKLHDPSYRELIKSRVKAVKADSPRTWGAMTVDQMVWHLAQALEVCLGRLSSGPEKAPFPLPKPVLRFFVLDMPWPKGAPTLQVTTARNKYDLEAERARCLGLIDYFTSRPLNGTWPAHPVLGSMSGDQYSRLQAKHFDHHLKQFGV
jgi:hypothetical protein